MNIVDKEFYTPENDKAELKKVKIQRDSSIPNVLIIGDSISIGYTPFVIKLLSGKANVHRVKTNCGDTNKGIEDISLWLGKTKWDIIHFNFGLHDLCYRHPDSTLYGHRDKQKGTIAVPLNKYKSNLNIIIEQLKKTNAKLIWASTTLVPEGEAGRFVGDDAKYNTVAFKLMKKHDIAINDLYTMTKAFDKSLFELPGDVHFKKDAYRQLAEQVTAKIKKQLESLK